MSPSRYRSRSSAEPPNDELQKLREVLNLEERVTQQISPRARVPNPFGPPDNEISASGASTPSRMYEAYIKHPDSPPEPQAGPGPSTSLKRRRSPSPSPVLIFDHISPPPLLPSPPRVKRRSKTPKTSAKPDTPIRAALARMTEAADSPAPQTSRSSVDSSRLNTPLGDTSSIFDAVMAGELRASQPGPLVPEALFRPECRPLRSWGSVPADIHGLVASPLAPFPSSSSGETGMEWLYEIVGADTESLTGGSENGSLSPAPSSAMSLNLERVFDRAPSNDSVYRPRRSSIAQSQASRRTMEDDSSQIQREIDSFTDSLQEKDSWLQSFRNGQDVVIDDELESEDGHDREEAAVVPDSSPSGQAPSDVGNDDASKMRSPDSGETREDEFVSSEDDNSGRLVVKHVCPVPLGSVEAEKTITALEQQLSEALKSHEELKGDIVNSAHNHKTVLERIGQLQKTFNEQAAQQKDVNQQMDQLSSEKTALKAEVAGLKKIKTDLEAEKNALAQSNKNHQTSIVDLLIRLHTAELALHDPDLPHATPLIPEPGFIDFRPDLEARLQPKLKVEKVNAHLRTYLFQLKNENDAIRARLDARLQDDEQRQIEILEGKLLEKLPEKREIRERRELEAARAEIQQLRAQNNHLQTDAAQTNASLTKYKTFYANFQRSMTEGANLLEAP